MSTWLVCACVAIGTILGRVTWDLIKWLGKEDSPMIGGSNALWSVRETAQYIGVAEDTLYKNWRNWGMTGYRIGRNIKFRSRDIEAWLEASKAE